MTHELKVLPKCFQAIWDGAKTFELRRDYRGYQTADRLILREWKDGKFTGSMLVVTVTYVLRNCPEYGLKDGYCILGIKRPGFGDGGGEDG